MNLSNGRIWPYAIGGSIILIFGACVATVIIANKLPVEKSDTYMMGYHQADAKANELIKARIAFNKSYRVEYIMNWAEFFDMGGYAFFVWTSYGLTLVVMVANVIAPIMQRKKVIARIKRTIKREKIELANVEKVKGNE